MYALHFLQTCRLTSSTMSCPLADFAVCCEAQVSMPSLLMLSRADVSAPHRLPCCSDLQAAAHGAGFPAVGGLFAKEAIQLLQDFYVAGNPAGRPARQPQHTTLHSASVASCACCVRSAYEAHRQAALSSSATALMQAVLTVLLLPACCFLPAAPKPHRKVMEVPPWQQAQEQQQQQQPMAT